MTRRMPDTWLGRRLAFGMRRLAMAGADAPLDVVTLDRRMRLHPQDNVCEKRVLFMPQFFDPVELAALKQAARPGFTFVDLGANVGIYSLVVAGLAGGDVRVLAVEPQPDIFERLLFNIAANGMTNITALQCAVAGHTGSIDFFIDGGNKGQSSVRVQTGNRTTVPARTLHDLLREAAIERVDGMKIDIEGAEDSVLQPFLAEAPRSLWPRLLILENSQARWSRDCIALCLDQGYRLHRRTRLNSILELDELPGPS